MIDFKLYEKGLYQTETGLPAVCVSKNAGREPLIFTITNVNGEDYTVLRMKDGCHKYSRAPKIVEVPPPVEVLWIVTTRNKGRYFANSLPTNPNELCGSQFHRVELSSDNLWVDPASDSIY